MIADGDVVVDVCGRSVPLEGHQPSAEVGACTPASRTGAVWEPEGVSADAAPQQEPPRSDSKVASVAWAIATIVVALVAALIAWLALGDRGSETGPASNGTSPTQSAAPTTEAAAPTTEAPAAAPDAAAQTPPEEVKQLMLELQRRDADDPLAEGDVDAPVVMIEYADYRCPYCAKFHLEIRPDLQPLIDDGTLRVEFRDLVIFDEPSHQAAVAVRAAAEQGKAKEYQDLVFARSTEGHAELAREDFLEMAQEAGVEDVEAFEEALDSPELAQLVDADTAEGRSIGVSSTPTFLINTAVVQGAYPAQHLTQIIEQQKEIAQTSAD